MVYLNHSINGHVVSVYEVKERARIGRKAECEITIEDPTVSGVHAELLYDNENWIICDRNSTNGIRVNGAKVVREQLQDGSVVAIGTHEFLFSLSEPNGLDKTLKIKKSWIPGVYYTE